MVQMSDNMTKQAEEFPDIEMERNSIVVWNCNICTEKCEDCPELLKHMEDLHSEYPIECRVCLSRFMDDAELGIHIKDAHIQKKPASSGTGKRTARKTTDYSLNESSIKRLKKYFARSQRSGVTRRARSRRDSNSSEESYYKPKFLRNKKADYCYRCEEQFKGKTEWRNHVVLKHILPRNPYPIVEMNYIDIDKLRVSPVPMSCPDKCSLGGELKLKFCRDKGTYTIVERTIDEFIIENIHGDQISQSNSEYSDKLPAPELPELINSCKKKVLEYLGSSSDSIISSISSTNSHASYVSSIDSNTTSTTSTSTASESSTTTTTSKNTTASEASSTTKTSKSKTTNSSSTSTSGSISTSDDSVSVSSTNSRSSNSSSSANSTSSSSPDEKTTVKVTKGKESLSTKPKTKTVIKEIATTVTETEIEKPRPKLKIALKRVTPRPGHMNNANAPLLPPCSTDYICVMPTENENDLPIPQEKEKDVPKIKEKEKTDKEISKKENEKSNSTKNMTVHTETEIILNNPDDSKIGSKMPTLIPKIPTTTNKPKIDDSKPTIHSKSILALYLNNQYQRELKHQERKDSISINAETETNNLLEKAIDQILEEVEDDEDPEIVEIIIPDEIPERYRKLSRSKAEKREQLELQQDSRDNKMISEMPLIAKAIAFNNNNNNNNSATSNNNHSSSKSVQEIVMEKDKMNINNHENLCNTTTTTTTTVGEIENTSESNKSQLISHENHGVEVGMNMNVVNTNGEFERPRSQSNKSSSSSTTQDQDQDQNDETSQSNSSNCKENENENDCSKEMFENIDSNSTDLRIHIPEEGELDIDIEEDKSSTGNRDQDQNQHDKDQNNEKENVILSNSPVATPLAEDIEGENENADSERPTVLQDDFECQVCQKVFNSDEELETHFSTDHFRVGSSSHILESEEPEQDSNTAEQERRFLLQQQQLRQQQELQQFQQRRQIIDGEVHQKQPTVISRSPASTTAIVGADKDKVNMIPLDLSLSTTAGNIVRAPVSVIESSQYQRISPPTVVSMTARPSITHGLSASAVMQRMSQPQQQQQQHIGHHQHQQHQYQQQQQQQRLHPSVPHMNPQYPTSLHMALTNTNSQNVNVNTTTGRYLQQQSHSEQPRVVEITTAVQKVVPSQSQQQNNYRIATPTASAGALHQHLHQQQQQQYLVRNQTPSVSSVQQLQLQQQQQQHHQKQIHLQQLQQRTAVVASSVQQQHVNPNYRQHQLPNVHQHQQQGIKRSLSLEEQQYQHPKQPRIDHIHQQQHLESSNNYSALRICPTTVVDQQQQRSINNSQISPHQNQQNITSPDQMNSVRIGNAITLSVCPSIDNQQLQIQQQQQSDQHLSVNVHHSHSGGNSNSNSPHTPTSPFNASSAVANALAVRGVTVTPASPVYPGASHLNRLQNSVQAHGPAVLQALNHSSRPVYSPPTLQQIPISHVNSSANIPTHKFAMPKNPAPRTQQLQQQQQQQQHISPPLSVNSTASRPERPPTIDLTEDEIAAHQMEQAQARYIHAQLQRQQQQQQQHHTSQQQGQTRTMPLAQASPSNPISRSPNSGSISRPIVCNICNQLYHSIQLLEEHKIRYHPNHQQQSNANVKVSSNNNANPIPQPSPPQSQSQNQIQNTISQAQIQARQQHIQINAQQIQHQNQQQQQQVAIRQKSQSQQQQQQQQLVPSRSNVNSISPPRISPTVSSSNSKFMYIPLIDLSKLDSANLQKLDDLGVTCIIPLEGGPLDSARSPTMGIPIMPIRSSRTSNCNLPWENFLPIGPLSNPGQIVRSLHQQHQQNQHLHQQQQQHQSHTSKPHSNPNYPSH